MISGKMLRLNPGLLISILTRRAWPLAGLVSRPSPILRTGGREGAWPQDPLQPPGNWLPPLKVERSALDQWLAGLEAEVSSLVVRSPIGPHPPPYLCPTVVFQPCLLTPTAGGCPPSPQTAYSACGVPHKWRSRSTSILRPHPGCFLLDGKPPQPSPWTGRLHGREGDSSVPAQTQTRHSRVHQGNKERRPSSILYMMLLLMQPKMIFAFLGTITHTGCSGQVIPL